MSETKLLETISSNLRLWFANGASFAVVILLALTAQSFTYAKAAAQRVQSNAQPGQSNGRSTTTLRVSTRIVVLDVVVTDMKGKLVSGMSKDNFTIVDDKTPQTILSFEAPSQHLQSSDVVVRSTADLDKIGDAPVTILVLDEVNTPFESMAFARQAMTRYLKAQPGQLRQPTEMLMLTNTRFDLMHDFTQDREALLEVTRRQPAQIPYKAYSGQGGSYAVERIAQTLLSLESLAQASGGTRGRKNVIWVGSGFPTLEPTLMSSRTAAKITGALRSCTDKLLAARITLDTINPEGIQQSSVTEQAPEDLQMAETETNGDPALGGVSFASLAPQTGGQAFYWRNDVDNEISDATVTGSTYYVLSYRPLSTADETSATPKYHSIRVIMRNPNLRAMTRNGYYPQNEFDAHAAATSTTEEQVNTKNSMLQLGLDLSSAVNTAMAYNALQVSAEKDGTACVVHVHGLGLSWRGAGEDRERTEATVVAAWYDKRNKVLGHTARELVATRSAGSTQDAIFTMQVQLTQNPNRLRFIVRDVFSGKIGTADLKP